MSTFGRSRRCAHIKVAGHRCGSPALRGEDFCYFHALILQRISARVHQAVSSIALVESEEAIQVSLITVIDSILKGTIELKRAQLILRLRHGAPSAGAGPSSRERVAHSRCCNRRSLSFRAKRGICFWPASPGSRQRRPAHRPGTRSPARPRRLRVQTRKCPARRSPRRSIGLQGRRLARCRRPSLTALTSSSLTRRRAGSSPCRPLPPRPCPCGCSTSGQSPAG
jgi:hypothetical protein